jgi:hypothetical protein
MYTITHAHYLDQALDCPTTANKCATREAITVKPFVFETSLSKIGAGIGAIFHEINRFVLFPASDLGK